MGNRKIYMISVPDRKFQALCALLLIVAICLITYRANALDYPHYEGQGITCESCHFVYDELPSNLPSWTFHVPQDIDDSIYNTLCWGCHDGEEAPSVETHSSLQIDDSYGHWSIECRTCHDPHSQKQFRKYRSASHLYTGQVEEVTATTLTKNMSDGVTWETDEYKRLVLIPNATSSTKKKYGYKILGNTGDTITVEGPINLSKVGDGDTFAVIYGKLIRSTIFLDNILTYIGVSTDIRHDEPLPGQSLIIQEGAGWAVDAYQGLEVIPNMSEPNYKYTITANSEDTLTVQGSIDMALAEVGDLFKVLLGKTGNAAVKFYRPAGTNSFADGDQLYNGVCEVCHSNTTHFRNDGSGETQNHENLDVFGKAGEDCIDCHSHDGGFGHGGADGGGCDECHGHDPGYDGKTGGAGSYETHSTHTENDDPHELKGPNIGCDACHDTDNFPSFADSVNYGDYKSGAAMTTVCDNCHSPDGTYDGVSDASVGAMNNWLNGVYEPDGTLKPGKEKWCATCHDEIPSVISGVTAPNVIGDEDDPFLYGRGYGYYKTGHGLDADIAYPSSGGASRGAGLECSDCHDYTASHIDGEARTYAAQSPDEYRTGYRLKQVDLGSGPVNPMHLPWPQNDSAEKERFALCASCHDERPFLGQNNDTNLINNGKNYHAFHIKMSNIRMDSDWNDGLDSRISCPVCHNVHGSQRLAMMRDGSLVGREPGFEIWYANPGIVSNVSGNATPPDPQDLTLIRSTGIIMLETSSVRMCSACHNRQFTSEYTRATLRWKGGTPALDWTRELYYENRGIHTDRLFNTTENVPFRVMYFDPDNDAPSTIELWIDHNDNGSYDAGETTVMAEYDPSDNTYTDGKIYRATVVLTDPGDKTIIYRVYASDAMYDAVGQPAQNQVIEWDDNFIREVPGEYGGIQKAVDAAYDGNTIIVSDGTYNENIDYLGKDLVIQSVNGAAMTLIKGSGSDDPVVSFDGGEPSSVILDGFTIDNVDTGTYYNMQGIRITNDSSPLLRNNFITGNNTRGKGAGIYIDGGAAIIENCTIDSNSTSFGTGGGVHIENSSGMITVTDSSISGNTSKISGAGLYVMNADIELTNVTLDNNRSYESAGGGVYFSGIVNAGVSGSSINGNVSKYSGAGIYFDGDGMSSLSISNSTVDSNLNNTTTPSYGGGIYLNNIGSTTTISNTSISFNNSKSAGGGIYAASAPVSLSGCTINNNIASNNDGGGIWANSSMTIADSDISGNRTSHAPEDGGGIYGTGSTTVLTITNTHVDNNQSNNGAGIAFWGQQLNFTGGSINGNVSPGQYTGGGLKTSAPVSMYGTEVIGNSSGNGGAGISITNTLTITNSIVANNYGGYYYWARGGGIRAATIEMMNSTVVGNATSWGGGIFVSSGGNVTNSIIWNNYSSRNSNTRNFRGDPTSATVSFTDTAGGGYVNGGSNISDDPLFVNERPYSESPTTAGDYHLRDESPCREQATGTVAPSDDIDNDLRPFGTGYDMGADEYLPDI